MRRHEREQQASGRAVSHTNYLLRRWKRVRLSIFLCFFLRMRLRRFLISEPMGWTRYRSRALVHQPPLGGPTP